MTTRESQWFRRVPALATAHIHAGDVEAMDGLGMRLAQGLAPPLVITLRGELGSGKTTLVRAMLRALGWTGPVKSPTYSLLEHYLLSSLYFYHFDFYRVEDPNEWESTGFAEYFTKDSVCMVEWPDRVGGYLPPGDLAVEIAYAGPESLAGRDLTFIAHSPAGLRCLRTVAPGEG
ncbi:MAG: tRNA (adenosine(37)-N6)-threonylcarbamoyltransferase complex ATPase subunit type 1 TsaE [Casimicrobiaceae bacterium]